MSKHVKTLLAKYLGSAAFVGLLAWLYISQRPFAESELVDQYLMLCDAFFIPGVLLVMFGCLMWVSTTGFFDGISYAVGMAVRSLIPGGRTTDESYVDYIMRKRENRAKGYGFLFYSGLVTVAVSGVFMVLYYRLYS